jgi:DNA ligase-1
MAVTTQFKPMLAGKLESLKDVQYPALATPKIDGIRCLTAKDLIVKDSPTVGLSRKLKPIPNRHVQSLLRELPPGLDGELWVPGAKTFGDVTSAIMSEDGKPAFEYLVFDHFQSTSEAYRDRAAVVEEYVTEAKLPWLKALRPTLIESEYDLLRYEEVCLAEGHEGVMLRKPEGGYKFGRATVRSGWLVKLKRFEDAEALVVGYAELNHNENEAEKDALGHTKRSSAKAGKVGGGVLGKLICVPLDQVDAWKAGDEVVEFEIGSGFTATQREELWAQRGALPGRFAKFRHQPHGAKEKPRFPVFLGFRHEADM